MKLEALKLYKTKAGTRASTVMGPDNIYGTFKVYHEVLDRVLIHTEDGSVFEDEDSDLCIISEWEEPAKGEFWMNVYMNCEGDVLVGDTYPTKERADMYDACSPRVDCIHFKWTEGKGLEVCQN